MFFNYRGVWNAEGEFSFSHSEQDLKAVIAYFQDGAVSEKLKLKVNPYRISLIGHNMGSHIAIAGNLDNQTSQCAVACDGAKMGAGGKGIFSNTLFMLAG